MSRKHSHEPLLTSPADPVEISMDVYDALDSWAYDLVGLDWQNDQVFGVKTSKTVEYPTHKKGIERQSHYERVTYDFSAMKHPTDAPHYPFANAFELAETRATPIDIEDISLEHVDGVIGHFLEHFSEEMYDFAATLTTLNPEDSDGVLDYDSIEPEIMLEICELVCNRLELDIQRTALTGYRVLEWGNRLDHYLKHTYQVGSTSYEVLAIDSSSSGDYSPAHSKNDDGHAEEVYFVQDTDKTPLPAREMITDEIGQKIIDEDEFFAVIGHSFGDADHMAVPYVEHAKRILRIIKTARGRKY